MEKLRLINIEFNSINHFVFEILTIELGRFEGTLLGMGFAFGHYWDIDILFIHFEIKSPIF